MQTTLQARLHAAVNAHDFGEGRQTKATKRGFLIEKEAVAILSEHPRVASVETQIFVESIDEFSQIDIVITTDDGKKIYIPVAVDLWVGTSQQDRLQANYYKLKTGQLDDVHFCYLCFEDVRERLNWKPKRSSNRRGVTITRVLATMFEEGNIHNIDTLWDYITNV